MSKHLTDEELEEVFGENGSFTIDPSWQPVELLPFITGDAHQPMPTVLRRADEAYLLYEKSINGAHGDSGAGKGWLVCFGVHQCLRSKRGVLLLDFEDTAASIVSRLLSMGVTPESMMEHLLYIRPQTEFGPSAVAHVIELCRTHNVGLVVIDSVGEAFALEGIDENKDVEVGPWYRRVPRKIADAGPAVLLVDHSTKASDNPLHPSGSKRKRAAITGASYFVEAVKPFVKNQGGRLKLTCAKDRHGNYRKGEVVAHLVMAESLTSRVRLELHAPDRDDKVDEVGAVLAARAACKAAKAEGKPLSKSALRGVMKVKTSTDNKRAGIDLAISRGALKESAGPSNARLVEYVSDFVDMPDEVTP